MLALLKGSTVAAGVLAATVTAIVFAQTGQGSASGTTVSAGAPLSASAGKHHGHHGRPQQNCPGGVCTSTEGGWDGPNIQINGDHFNYGPVVVEILGNDGTVLWSGVVNTGPYTGFLGGAFAARTDIDDCSQVPNTTNNVCAIAYDTVSGRWSNRVSVDSSCASL